MGKMGSKEDNFVYHITTLNNFNSIINNGIIPRKQLIENEFSFVDIANPDIINKRSTDAKVLFHLTPYNIFSYALRNKFTDWVYILVSKQNIEKHNYKVVKNHPLNECAEYFDTFEIAYIHIDWEKMKHPYSRWYDSAQTIDISRIKMSEVQVDGIIDITEIGSILVGDLMTGEQIVQLLQDANIVIDVYLTSDLNT